MEDETVLTEETLQSDAASITDYIHREESPHNTTEAVSCIAPQAMDSKASSGVISHSLITEAP